jgi:tetratricopeptide (TPR) repeat protein
VYADFMMQNRSFLSIFCILLAGWLMVTCLSCAKPAADEPAAYSLNGEPLFAPPPSGELLEQLTEKERLYRENKEDPDRIIWYGRFTAYAGQYQEAIRIFSEGIRKFPDDARFYRHRGHRYITIRKFDEAIGDLEKAAELIRDQPDEVEPDGMPNEQNIPVSTLQGNIWYHLGLASYLKKDFTKALSAFINGLRTSANDDNLVSASHWIYTIMCRNNPKEDPTRVLSRISDSLHVIENQSYYQLCRLYQGRISPEEVLQGLEEGPARDAVDYGIARWYACHGNQEKSREILYDILNRPGWASFGYIAAEADIYGD